MQIDAARLSATLQHLYSAVLESEERARLPDTMAAAFDASSCLMHMRESAPQRVDLVGSTENLSPVIAAYAENREISESDAWSVRAAQRLGQACLGEDVVPEQELLAAEWYNELCRPVKIHHLVGACFEVDAAAKGLIGVHRPPGAAPFETADRTKLQLLLPHLRQAYRLMRQADAQERSRRLSFEALASLAVAVFIVNSEGHVRLMNSAAERVARLGVGLRASHGRIGFADVKLDERLRSAIRAAALAPLGRSISAGETIVGQTKDGAPLSLMVSPLPPDTSSTGPAEALAVIFVGDPATGLEPSMELVRAAYGLTAAETRVLFAIVAGERPSDYAAANGISQNTVQTQLKSLFAKTGCHRQADLVRKVLNDPVLRLAQNLRP